jgi:hypothetical protein
MMTDNAAKAPVKCKLIKENSDKLIIEGRPKLSVTKVSRLEVADSRGAGSNNKKNSPAVPKFKLSASPMPDSNKKKDMLDNNSSKKANFGGSVSKAQWTVTAADNVPSFNGKLKIKVGGASLQPSDHNNKNSNEKSTDGQEPGGSEQGLTFAFAGKPTYSPSRIEPSCGSGNANGTTVQTKGKCSDFLRRCGCSMNPLSIVLLLPSEKQNLLEMRRTRTLPPVRLTRESSRSLAQVARARAMALPQLTEQVRTVQTRPGSRTLTNLSTVICNVSVKAALTARGYIHMLVELDGSTFLFSLK